MKSIHFFTALAILFSAQAFSQNIMAETSLSIEKESQPEPLYVIKLSNGEAIVNQSIFSQFDTNWIESITIVKDKESEEIKQYGKRAENGLVLIYIKKENEEDMKKILPM